MSHLWAVSYFNPAAPLCVICKCREARKKDGACSHCRERIGHRKLVVLCQPSLYFNPASPLCVICKCREARKKDGACSQCRERIGHRKLVVLCQPSFHYHSLPNSPQFVFVSLPHRHKYVFLSRWGLSMEVEYCGDKVRMNCSFEFDAMV